MRFCEECGAPVTERMLFCERCGALVGNDEEGTPREITQRMPNLSRPSSQPQAHHEIQPPIPVMDASRTQSEPNARHGQTRGADASQSPGHRNEPKRKSASSGAVGWVLAGMLTIAVAILIGYIIGTSNQPGNSTRDDSDEIEWANTDRNPSRNEQDGEGTNESKTEGGSEDEHPNQGAEDDMDDQPEESGSNEGKEQAAGSPSEDKSEDNRTDEENETEKRMRESVSTEMLLRPDGQLSLSVSIPTDNKGLSERIEVEQDGKIVYSSRILAPGETLEWVPADDAHAGPARMTVYGILGDKDYGKPVTVDAEIIDE